MSETTGEALRGRIAALEAAIGDPRQGLPEDVFRFVSRVTPLVNVDLLIQDAARRTLLTWREDELFGAGWHIPGSIVRYQETLADRVRACARGELGADVTVEDVPLMILETIGPRRTRGHHVSLLFRCRLTGGPDERRRAVTDPPQGGQWRWHASAPPNLLPAQARYAHLL